MTESNDDDVWELVEYSMLESLVLRSLLEYLRITPVSWEKKEAKIAKWQSVVSLQFGNPSLVEQSHQIIQRLRAAPPDMRKIILRELLNLAHSKYFDPDA